METPATKWQPIATVPKDTPILVTDGEIIVVVERGEYWRGVDTTWPVGFGGGRLGVGFRMGRPDPLDAASALAGRAGQAMRQIRALGRL